MKYSNELQKGDRFYKMIVTCPIKSELGKCIIKISGIFNKKNEMRCVIIFHYENGEKSFYEIPTITKESFDNEIILDLIPKLLKNDFTIPEDHFKVVDLSNIDNLDDQFEELKKLDAIKTYSEEEYATNIKAINKSQFTGEALH